MPLRKAVILYKLNFEEGEEKSTLSPTNVFFERAYELLCGFSIPGDRDSELLEQEVVNFPYRIMLPHLNKLFNNLIEDPRAFAQMFTIEKFARKYPRAQKTINLYKEILADFGVVLLLTMINYEILQYKGFAGADLPPSFNNIINRAKQREFVLKQQFQARLEQYNQIVKIIIDDLHKQNRFRSGVVGFLLGCLGIILIGSFSAPTWLYVFPAIVGGVGGCFALKEGCKSAVDPIVSVVSLQNALTPDLLYVEEQSVDYNRQQHFPLLAPHATHGPHPRDDVRASEAKALPVGGLRVVGNPAGTGIGLQRVLVGHPSHHSSPDGSISITLGELPGTVRAPTP